jgi:hypothetical protein
VLTSIDCRQIGLLGTGGAAEFEHPLRALLAEHNLDQIRIEHVGVTNPSAPLVSRWPPFQPCALLSADSNRATRPRVLQLEGRTYHQAWPSGRATIYLPDDR